MIDAEYRRWGGLSFPAEEGFDRQPKGALCVFERKDGIDKVVLEHEFAGVGPVNGEVPLDVWLYENDPCRAWYTCADEMVYRMHCRRLWGNVPEHQIVLMESWDKAFLTHFGWQKMAARTVRYPKDGLVYMALQKYNVDVDEPIPAILFAFLFGLVAAERYAAWRKK